MSETKHTPGPWQYFFEHETVAFIVELDGTVIAKLSVFMNSTGHSALVANTRLCAAAPELLEALEALQPYVLHLPDGAPIKETIRAAIAKAKGEAP